MKKHKIFYRYDSSISKLYHISITFRLLLILLNLSILLGISWIFYRHLLPGILFSFLSVYIYDMEYDYIINRRKTSFSNQFKDMLTSVNSAVSTGYSLENATKEAYIELRSMYGENSYICTETAAIIHQLNMGTKIETAYEHFACRTRLEAAFTFAEILSISKRTSGNIPSIIKSTCDAIISRLDSEREIKHTISSKLFERNIMVFMPVVIIFYVNATSPGFLTPLYSSVAGRLVMTACLIIYGFAVWLSNKIFTIRI